MRIDPITTAKLTLSDDEKKTLEYALDILWDIHETMNAKKLQYIKSKKEWYNVYNLFLTVNIMEFLIDNTSLELSTDIKDVAQ